MQLPDRPNIRHLRDQAKTLLRFGTAPTLADAQFQVARQYGLPQAGRSLNCTLSHSKSG